MNLVASADERAGLCALASATPGPCWDRLLFSAKESIYKAWFPLTRRWLGFEDTVITINPANGTFTVRLLVPGPALDGRSLTRFEGRWLVRDGLVLTAIAVPARPELCHRLWLAWRPLPAKPAILMRVACDGGPIQVGAAAAGIGAQRQLAALGFEYDADVYSNDTDFARLAGLRCVNPLA